MIGQLKKNGMRITSQRLAIIDVLVEKGELHPGVRLIYEEVKKKKKGLSLSTTYATLNELSRLGILRTLQFDQMENRYEGNLEDHINLICMGCGKILDHKAAGIVDRRDVSLQNDFTIIETRFDCYGYCSDCGKKREKGNTV